MKTIKYFCLSALALTLAACSNDDNEVTQQPAEQVQGIPFTATISVGQSGSNRALAEDGTKLVATWAVGEKVALIHNGVNDEMEVASVSGGVATISGTITGSPSTGDAVTIIYPSTAANEATGNVKASLLKQQEGTLEAVSAKYDVRKGTGTLKVDGVATLSDNVSLTNQFAIWKLNLRNTPKKSICIFAGSVPIAGATRAEASMDFYVAVPAFTDQTVSIYANNESDACYYYARENISLVAGKYYQSSFLMSPLSTSSLANPYMITGSSSATIPDGSTAVLSGVSISGGSITCAGTAGIILLGSNSISAAKHNAAIRAGGPGSTLTINGTGSLSAQGGGWAAGIGSNKSGNCGNINIYGGIISVTGGLYGAAIGSGDDGECGNITFTSGVISVTAIKNNYLSDRCIGAGNGGSCGTVTIGGVNTGQITTSPYVYQPQ